MHLCDWSNFHTLLNKLTEQIIKQEKTITPFAALALIDNPELQKRNTEISINDNYPADNAQPIIGKYPKHQKIRIGYFSADFREHPVSSLTVELFELHNRDQFEIIAFSFGVNTNDPLRKRLEIGFDQFIDVSDKTDTQITLLAREMEIDIAVDLGGFTAESRTGIFAARAAPVQVNYLGYAGTMFAEYMDYIIADPTLIPDEKQCHYSEKVAYLPNTYMVNDSSLQISEVPFSRKDVEIPEKAFIFACFNASYKITPATFLGWMRILSAVENSVLWLSNMNQTAKNNLKNLAVEQGIDKDRIIFASRMPSVSDHLNRIRLADLFLDTFPFNAHTTSNDALRVGLPVLTLMGKSFPSRVAASLLNAVNLPELITNHQHEYEALAIDLGSHPEKLVHIKNKLKSNLETSPLCNTKLFAQHIESLYQVMYQRHHDELMPDQIYFNSSTN
jgi:predicted O-linked N-acetylglucosamine transferase (SPINDLY family)